MRLFLPCSSKELNLDVVLLNGQSFRWQKIDQNSGTAFVGVTRNRVWKIWRETPNGINFEIIGRFNRAKESGDVDALRDFFQLHVDVNSLYEDWMAKDEHFSNVVKSNGSLLEGIRILKLDPLEALFTFICTANNNIRRITAMVNRLCEEYGEVVETSSAKHYDFPSLEQLRNGLPTMESKLREAGFGYRAKYIAEAVKKLSELGGEDWLDTLVEEPYAVAKPNLIQIPGVGPKVADCVCLMGLQKHQVVPVDTHVFQITTSIYLPHLKSTKSISNAVHEKIGSFYEERFGPYAGWAHSILFSAQLKHFGAKSNVK